MPSMPDQLRLSIVEFDDCDAESMQDLMAHFTAQKIKATTLRGAAVYTTSYSCFDDDCLAVRVSPANVVVWHIRPSSDNWVAMLNTIGVSDAVVMCVPPDAPFGMFGSTILDAVRSSEVAVYGAIVGSSGNVVDITPSWIRSSCPSGHITHISSDRAEKTCDFARKVFNDIVDMGDGCSSPVLDDAKYEYSVLLLKQSDTSTTLVDPFPTCCCSACVLF